MADKTFSEALNDLQNAASEITKQATTLEDSIKLFESGVKDADFCKDILDSVEQKISIYGREDENA